MNNLKSLADFENKIRRWEPDGYDCKLCKDFASNIHTYIYIYIYIHIYMCVYVCVCKKF